MVASGESGADVLPIVAGGLQPSDIVKALQLDADGNLKTALPNNAATQLLQESGNASLVTIEGKLPALVSGRIPTDPSGVISPVSVASLPLPSGASTSALQTAGNGSLGSIDGKIPALVSGRLPVDPSGVTSPVSASALPLPAGASTSALQTTGNNSLSSIDSKLPTLGQKAMAASVPVVLPSDQIVNVVLPTGANASFVGIIDSLGVNKVKVNADGTLAVSTATVAPPNTISIEALIEGSVAGSTLVDTPYIIPNNTTLYLQSFKFGCYSSASNESRGYLYQSETAAIGVLSKLISIFYTVWGTLIDPLTNVIVGDGNRRLIMRRQRVDATARNMFAMITGYITYNTITVDETNTATTVTATTVTRTGAGWTVNAFAGKYIRMNGGTPMYIASNTATVITITGNIPIVGSSIPYQIVTFNP